MSSFDEILAGVKPNPELCQSKLAGLNLVKRNYIILFGARTGSTWLTHLLKNLLGNPDEYINPNFLVGNANRTGATEQRDFMGALRSITQTNGVFGIEATCEHIKIFGENKFFASIPNPVVFYLWRENLVAQAVSLYRAVKSGYFHSIKGEQPPDPECVPEEIVRWYKYMATVENENVKLLERRNLPSINLTYETIFKDPRATLELFFTALDRPPPHPQDNKKNPLKKLGDEWNENAELQFRNNFPELIAEVEMNRLVRKKELKSVL